MRGMFAEFFLPGFRWLDFPDGLHLFAAIDLFHQFVLKRMPRLFVLGGPDDGFGGVGEITAGKVGRRIGLHPGDVVEELGDHFAGLAGDAAVGEEVGRVGEHEVDGGRGIWARMSRQSPW